MSVSDLFWEASYEELKKGYIEDDEYYICLLCGEKIEKGIIYLSDDIFYEAEKYMRIHIKKEHKSVFEYLLEQDKKLTGLSEHQSNLLKLFYQSKSDLEIQKELGIGSSSTIRNHRFVLREKERQSKVFLAMMELLKEENRKFQTQTSMNKSPIAEDNGVVAPKYKAEGNILRKYFPQGVEGPLKTFDMKEKNRVIVLREIARRFEENRTYSEKEVDEILEGVYEDYVVLRRYLIEYGFMDRKADCSEYWVKPGENRMEEKYMDRRKELIREYKEAKKEGGVYQIRNTKNQKIFVTSTPNLKTINGVTMLLKGGNHKNKQLQADWFEFGEAAFVFEILEVLEEKEEGFFDKKEELKKLEKKWLDKLEPYGERGYNKQKVR